MATQPPSSETDEETVIGGRNADVCNVAGSIGEIGSKWTLVVLNDLRDGEQRFDELERSTGASSGRLSRVLADPEEEEGSVENREEFEPPVASYSSVWNR